MLDELLGINPTTVVVMKDSNPVLMPWIDKAPEVLEAWNQGTEDGHVVADLLFGVVNPSGKVPTTYPRSQDDTLCAGRPERYPGDAYPVIRYSEGLQIGYRWFQAKASSRCSASDSASPIPPSTSRRVRWTPPTVPMGRSP